MSTTPFRAAPLFALAAGLLIATGASAQAAGTLAAVSAPSTSARLAASAEPAAPSRAEVRAEVARLRAAGLLDQIGSENHNPLQSAQWQQRVVQVLNATPGTATASAAR